MPTSQDFHGQARDLLGTLPADLDWLVAFDLHALRQVADEAVLRAAWFLPEDAPMPEQGAAVLTSAGTAVMARGAAAPAYWSGEAPWPAAAGAPSLLDVFAERLAVLGEGNLLCIGLGHGDAGQGLPAPPVAMTVEALPGGEGLARAAFDRAPDTLDYELLAGCGVRFEGSAPTGRFHVACFRNRLSAHLTAALGSAFARTTHCNLFFFRGGLLDERLVEGLARAGEARLQVGLASAKVAAVSLALAARRAPMSMTAIAPPPEPPMPMGDLVPLGLLLHALRATSGDAAPMDAAAQLLERHLDARRENGLWPFQTGRLITATDSGLVLLGRRDNTAVARLEQFADGQGGYLPQLSAAEKRPGRMQYSPEVRHWCQADLGTTLLVRILRQRAGLPQTVPLALLERHFATRGALFFANPFLLDWLLAEAVADDPAAAPLRAALAADIAKAVEADGGFGQWDRGLSTACAVLALAACGRRGRLMRLAQLRLLEMVDPTGQPEICTPFYSTLRIAQGEDGPLGAVPDQPGLLRPGGPGNRQRHALTLYEDSFRMVTTALRLRALGEPCDPILRDLPGAEAVATRHARYSCADIRAYVRDVALAPYLAPPAMPRTAEVA
jgi:hypothetical protein